MSKKFAFVKAAYERGSWDVDMVRAAVAKAWITAEEFTLITGEAYE